MRELFESSKDNFDNWVDQWDKALKSDIFKDAPRPAATSKQTSDDSFFGLQQSNPTSQIDSTDVQYWNAINSLSDGGVEMQRLDESQKTPNPIKSSSEGEDQKLEPQQLGLTFSEEDIKNLEEMKVKLYELESKVAKMDDKSYEPQIKAMIEKIDNLSNKMCGVRK